MILKGIIYNPKIENRTSHIIYNDAIKGALIIRRANNISLIETL
jgi:hypothetical protein